MNVLIVGSGGRENALAYKISQSKLCENLYIAPGNPGTTKYGTNISIDVSKKEIVLKFCKENFIDLVVIGPEKPLADGLGDYLRKNKINVFGPNKLAAEIESSKVFAKDLMKKYNIPSAAYETFNKENIEDCKTFLKNSTYPVVIKADGLAAGKGVVICSSYSEAANTVDEIFKDKIFGDAGSSIVIEEFMVGEEASIFAITDGSDFYCLPSAQDHKRIGDNDEGKNTGGMGAYSPAPIVNDKILKSVETNIIRPVLDALQNEGRPFSGCLYCGLMITKDGPKVVEFNCRFGDPETQAVMLVIEGDFLKLLYSAAIGRLDKTSVKYNGGSAICVVAASSGYPEKFETGYIIEGTDEVNEDNIVLFHSGTQLFSGKLVTSGGRVLNVCAYNEEMNLKNAKEKAYRTLEKIQFFGKYFRKDIGDKGIK